MSRMYLFYRRTVDTHQAYTERIEQLRDRYRALYDVLVEEMAHPCVETKRFNDSIAYRVAFGLYHAP